MRPSFIPRLVNGPFEDPGLLVPLTFRKRALLFDLGDLTNLSSGDILKTTHAFVTHTHMDHFAGFDQLLRLLLGRAKTLHIFGPKGFLKNIEGKLQAYTWNLVRNYEEGLDIAATEIDSASRTTAHFRCRDGFIPTAMTTSAGNLPLIHAEPAFTIEATILDHQIPCLAFAVQERFHVNILKPQLEQLGLEVGPWLSRFKEMLFNETDPATVIDAQQAGATGSDQTFSVGALSRRIARITPGQKIAYVTDALYCDENVSKIVALAHGADQLFIEAAFLEKDRETAKEKHHLTAHQAGTIARKARVRTMHIFHHSPRYSDQAHLLREEARQAFGTA